MSAERYDKLFLSLRYFLIGRRYNTALKAFDLARRYHTGKRKDNITPELQHQVEIALYVITLKDVMDEEMTIAASMLHDLKEDYPVRDGEITAITGSSYLEDVCNTLNKKGKDYDLYFSEIAKSPTTSIVKGADRIHNINSMGGVWSAEKQQSYVDEVKKYFLPMLKTSRSLFPEQLHAYFNIEYMLKSQVRLVENGLENK